MTEGEGVGAGEGGGEEAFTGGEELGMILMRKRLADDWMRQRCRPGGNPGPNGWFLQSTPMQMPPRRGGICGRLTEDLPSTRLQGGCASPSVLSRRMIH